MLPRWRGARPERMRCGLGRRIFAPSSALASLFFDKHGVQWQVLRTRCSFSNIRDRGGRGRAMSMNSGSRHEAIRALVARTGFITIEALAQRFGVTPQTVRRDINYLAKRGDIRRYHGGAGLPSSVENAAYTTRRVHNARSRSVSPGLSPHRSPTTPRCSSISAPPPRRWHERSSITKDCG